MKKIFFLAATVLLLSNLLCEKAKAQFHPDLTVANFVFPDTTFMGASDTAVFLIMNTGTDSCAYADNQFTVYIYKDSGNAVIPTFGLLPSDTFYSAVNNGVLVNGSSVLMQIPIPISPSFFRAGGDNEIVIWPKPAPAEQDSVNNFYKKVFYIKDGGAGIANLNPQRKKLFSIYPTIIEEKFTIDFDKTVLQKSVQLQITDLVGRGIHEENFSPTQTRLSKNTTDFNLQQPGVYLVYLKAGNQSWVQKVVVAQSE